MQASLGRARSLLGGFTPGQRGVILVAVVALALGAVALTRWVSQPTWAPLYGNLEGTDANAIVEQLQGDGVAYKLADSGHTVLVPQAQVYDLRVSLSGKGLPATSSTGGYSLLDDQGITATDFQQNVAYRRALEGELSKTLQAIDGVRTAVVHLALPKRDVFATEADTPTASVLMSLQPGTTLDRRQVLAITHLVAGSVEGLDPKDVTVSDSTGRLLSTAGVGAAGSASAAGDTDEETAQYEDRLGDAVQNMLDQVLGSGRSVVRVNAALDFDTTETTSETYVTDTAQPLAEATVKETYNGTGAGAGGALGLTEPTLSAAAGATDGGNYQRDQRTVNNAVGKVVERSQAAPGAVDRLTVAVVIDSKLAGSANENTISQLVANAVGLDPQRGDSVQVEKIPFDTTATEAAAKEVAAAEKAAKTAGYIELGRKAGLGLLLLIVVVLLLRKRKRSPEVEATASDLVQLSDGYVIQPAPAAMQAIANAELAALPSAEEAARDRDAIREQVSQLVDSQPEDVAAVIQSWLAERKA
jgi:flagellar M-ring protein FliF